MQKPEESSTSNLVDAHIAKSLFSEPKRTDMESLHVAKLKDTLLEAVLDISTASQEVGKTSTLNDMVESQV